MSKKPPNEPLIIVLGATGTGKSQLAVDLATRFDGEIINGDAMQMYDGLPIVTNKLTLDERKGIPHHLLGFIPLDEEPWTVGLFKKKAGQIITGIRSRGRLPIVVGGTHYYTQALLWEDALVVSPSGEDEVQAHVPSHEIARRYPILEDSTEVMIERLREIDPAMATRWHPNDRRKIRRSLEIYLATGKKASEIYAEQSESLYLAPSKKVSAEREADRSLEKEAEVPQLPTLQCTTLNSTLLFWVHTEASTLKTRLDSRVDKMLEAGLLSEVKSMNAFLHKQAQIGVKIDRTRGIWASIGFKEFEDYLLALEAHDQPPQELETLLHDAIERTKAATRQYAKRQIRWIRLKLMRALANAGALERLYLLDGSGIIQWKNTVSDPAIEVTGKFLAGYELPVPTDVSAAAGEVLRLSDADEVVRHECEVCNVVTVTKQQWQLHLKSRRHRGLLRKSAWNEESGRSRSHGTNDSKRAEGVESP